KMRTSTPARTGSLSTRSPARAIATNAATSASLPLVGRDGEGGTPLHRKGRLAPKHYRHRAVSEDVDAKIREQIKAGTFPVRLKPEDWQSGSVNWLLDVIAPDRKTAGQVIANFAQVAKEGELRLHQQIGGLVEKDMLEKMGYSQTKGE
ncbi:MAG: hypothetical protein ACRCSW_12490, partial [Tabrizicola sp.]